MYAKFFGLQHEPFSIAPDPRYLFMSERHRDALAHLLYGLRGGGGFVLLTGEIGAGKTTVCRCFLEQIPKRCNVAYIFNPKLTVNELLKTVCEEYGIQHEHPEAAAETVKQYLDPINEFLLRTHAVGQNNVLIIDEAQNLSAEVLEQLRLLTNLETNERKLLQIILIGQPELRTLLARPELEQLAQRVIARFHLQALSEPETSQYVRHRLGVAGFSGVLPFDRKALRRIFRLTGGVPRRINLLCDRALLGAYAQGRRQVDGATVDQAAAEVFDAGRLRAAVPGRRRAIAWLAGATGVVAVATAIALVMAMPDRGPARPLAAARPASSPTAAAPASRVAASSTSVVKPAASRPAPTLEVSSAAITWGLRDEGEAWRELAPAWRLTLPEGDPCPAAKRQQLQCFRSEGGLALLRLLDRPSLLTLRDDDGKPSYVLLLGLGSQHATVRAGSRTQTISLLALGRQWRGEFATLWRTPPGYTARLGPGPALDWLDLQLAQALGLAPGPAGRGLDAALRSRVAAFQRAQGMVSDGRVGPVTLMQLNRAAGVVEPRLQPLPTSDLAS
ncbi:ExeA family protein [Roseateles toxinivorans]|uniref:Type II secretion system protein A n=1 Tax=Roseateles toxinivorans TaxID=270368 RepID=A0A4R6QQ60_9BURK|nr:ExeA family protein [Roseateles toxinivorans]TDP72837.1 type II secretion system protein A [Roseateles toxinivorans]